MRRMWAFFRCFAAVGVITIVPLSFAQPRAPEPEHTDLKEITKNCVRYDGKVVTVVGFLRGSHVGTFIESEDHAAVIRVRLAENARGRLIKPVRDGLYERFEDSARSLYAPAVQHEPRAAVEVRAVISVLRRNGKVARSYNPYTEAPVELIPVQILKFDALK